MMFTTFFLLVKKDTKYDIDNGETQPHKGKASYTPQR